MLAVLNFSSNIMAKVAYHLYTLFELSISLVVHSFYCDAVLLFAAYMAVVVNTYAQVHTSKMSLKIFAVIRTFHMPYTCIECISIVSAVAVSITLLLQVLLLFTGHIVRSSATLLECM
jgi:hypothetical protein